VNWHIFDHIIVTIGAVLLFMAPFFGRYRSAPLHIRILLFVIGPVGIAWSIVGIYIMRHTNAHGHTTLPWSQFWMLSHTKSNLGGLGVGILLSLLINPVFYRRKRSGTSASNQSIEPTADRRDEHI
jgi:hypothetical protein